MKVDPLSRRAFLQGAAGVSLALPILPSLLSREAAAQAMPVQKTFVGVVANNGLYKMYGPDSQLMPKLPLDKATYDTKGLTATTAKHVVHSGSLAALAAANGGAISDIIDSSFTPLLPKMNMMQGLDFLALGYSHHQAHFGNCASDASSSNDGNPAQAGIDRVMAYASNFYKNPVLKGRAVAFTACQADSSSGYQAGYTWTDPNNPKTSAVAYTTPVYSNPATLFDAYFMTQTSQMTPLKKTLVDKVLADYKSLRSSNPRLGAADKAKLDLHISMIQETQNKVNAVLPVCTEVRPASNLTDRALILTTLNSVITSLVACGLCNSFLGWAHAIADSDPNNYHKWSHEGWDNDNATIANQTSYDNLLLNNRNIMKDICLDLATKLDQVHLLDNTLIACVQEHNKRGHESWNVPVITFGSAGGVLKTGQYLDYRDMSDRDDLVYSRFGYPMAQFLGNCLQAMDVPAAEYEPLNKKWSSQFKASSGYGCTEFNNTTTNAGCFDNHYGSSKWQSADLSEWLPGLKA